MREKRDAIINKMDNIERAYNKPLLREVVANTAEIPATKLIKKV